MNAGASGSRSGSGDIVRPAPLEGLKVLDFSRLFAGPYATMTLADLGAEVIKVESPAGDEARYFGPPFLSGEGMNFMALNRDKRSISLDLKHPEAVDVARRLAREADVVVENFRPGVAERLGIGYEQLRSENPGLVYCSISGFGREGAYQDRPALDVILQAMAGVMERQGRGGTPELLVVTVADTYAAALAVQSVLAALLARARDGTGQFVEVTLFEALIAAQGYRIISHAEHVMLPAMDDTVPYGAFQTADGEWLVIAVVSEKTWQALCTALGVPELIVRPEFVSNPDRVRHKESLLPILRRQFTLRSRAEWLELLEAAGVPTGPVRRVEDLIDDPHVLARRTIVELDHPACGRLRTLGSVLHLAETPTRVGRPAPRLGEHTLEVLHGLGLGPEEVDDLVKRGVARPSR